MRNTSMLIALFSLAAVAQADESVQRPVGAPLGQVIDASVPAYRPKFLAIQPLAGRYEERRWAYINTYPSYGLCGYGNWSGGNYGFGGFGFGGSGLGHLGGGASIQTNASYAP